MDSDEGARISCVEPDTRGSEAVFGVPRNRRADLAPIQENNHDGYRSGLARLRMSSCREPAVSSNNNTRNGSSSSSWLSSSLRGRCSPLLSRLRRHARDASAPSAAGLEEGYTHPQHLPRRWDNLEHNASQDDDDDDDEDDEEEKEDGAVGLEAFGEGRPWKIEDETLPELEDASFEFSPCGRVGMRENVSVPTAPLSGVENRMDGEKEKPISSRDQEKLRKIKER